MFKNLLLTSLLLFSLIGVIYPSKKESTRIFDYCYSLEKIISRNSIQTKRNLSLRVKSISENISKFGVSKSRGDVINKILNKYKASKNSFIINSLPNKFYCLSGYWIEKIKPGTFESIFYKESKKIIDEFESFKDEIDRLLNDVNSDFNIKNNLNNIF